MLKEEKKILQVVHVDTDGLISLMNVSNVTSDVYLVPTLSEIVQYVLKTEKKNQFVTVQMVLMKMKDQLYVQLVNSNVELVTEVLNTVKIVLMDMSMLQNVPQLHMKENLLKFSIFQLDLSKSLLVSTVVNPVLEMVKTVKFVPPTDPTHHSADVLIHTSKI